MLCFVKLRIQLFPLEFLHDMLTIGPLAFVNILSSLFILVYISSSK